MNINTQVPVTSAGQLVISEFRTSGPSGPSDEFVELYNTTGAPLIVQSVDDSAGLGVFASDGILRCVVPNNTVIPINGHYLCANGVSAGAPGMRRPAQASFAPDQFINLDIPTNAGIALFNTAATGQEFQVLANRIDAVGPTTPTLKEVQCQLFLGRCERRAHAHRLRKNLPAAPRDSTCTLPVAMVVCF